MIVTVNYGLCTKINRNHHDSLFDFSDLSVHQNRTVWSRICDSAGSKNAIAD